MRSKEGSEGARSLLAAFLREHPDAGTPEIQAFAAQHPREASELATLFAQIEELRGLLDLPAGVIAEHLLDSASSTVEGPDDPFPSSELELHPATDVGLAELLPRKTDTARRYRVDGEIARGGMGSILKVWDRDLHRFLAMKVARAKTAGDGKEIAEDADSGKLARFLEEAQITGQLDHPGIVPVHELGLDERGRVFFTMKLVKGRTLKEVIDEHRRGEGGWTLTRVLGLLLKVCEAMSYAHDKGVVHRDLKPINVMIGRYGEVYVMDWGLAKVLRATAPPPPRQKDQDVATQSQLDTFRLRETSEDPQSPLWTVEGNVVGTPPFMAPEQAAGEPSAVGPLVDVYAAGAILYQLLTGRLPYVDPQARYNAHVTWLMVRTGPPKSVSSLAPDRPAELVAICEKAMARDVDQRYPSMAALAEDLRAFLEGRVVHAFETGAWADARKWIVRNRALAFSLTAAILGLAGGLVASLILHAYATRNEKAAIEERNKVLQISTAKRLEELLADSEKLWPVHSSSIPAMQDWIRRARALRGHEANLRQDLDELRRQGSRSGEEPVSPSNVVLAAVTDPRTPEDAAVPAVEQRWVFAEEATQWYHDTLARLVDDLERLTDPDPDIGAITRIAARIDKAELAHYASLVDPAAQDLWTEAIASIRDRSECPAYAGLEIQPQEGLLPIGRDPLSGLWEFAHVASGEAAIRDSDGSLFLIEESGIVFVLIPPGKGQLGGQSIDPSGPNYDRWATLGDAHQGPRECTFHAFFCSKYELTQGQWITLSGSNPSGFDPEDYQRAGQYSIPPFTKLHPVEQVSWNDCLELCEHFRLAIPTMDQWEYAARAGGTTPFTDGSSEESLLGVANIHDRTSVTKAGSNWPSKNTDFVDGWCFTAPVGLFRANGFGLHDVLGNVGEWCSDPILYGSRDVPGVQSPQVEVSPIRAYCGGCYFYPSTSARLCSRDFDHPSNRQLYIGLRVIRAIEQ